ncbi:PKD domain-containing protein [Cellulophaga baltica]|uniref:PKD domain-containing protein n=1 Tax=Cellulophaga TaxID=104264 RepID=UPI001C069EC1|nr:MULTISPECIES: PKD domain-containing protein [Cellulophaga]MBU2997294.1 PKD domain-containing protein [Cellulophaga baltica]MDO6768692.1 PKD domain-containing protein [Cellulophaga sp. 1_MG-2023]
MKKYLYTLKYMVLGAFVSLTSCVSDDLADVGDLEDITGPTPFYSVTDVTTSEFDCNDVELAANYDFNFLAGSNLAVNGTNYEWSIEPSEGVSLINKDLPILELLIDAELAEVVALEEDIAAIEFKLPCETDQDVIDVMEAELAALEESLLDAEASLSDETLANVAALETQIQELEAGTLNDREIIFSFPEPGTYTVGLTVTDNLGKSASTEQIITVNQAVPTIPVPEIGEPGFEVGTLFDGSGDGRDSWRVPSNADWSPTTGGTTVIQINAPTNESDLAALPEGVQAAKLPASGDRVIYQEIEVSQGVTYVLTYFSAFSLDTDFGEVTVSILNPNTSTYAESKLEENILATRTDTSVGRTENVFQKHAITFEAGENESVIIYGTVAGDEVRLDAFDIIVKQ